MVVRSSSGSGHGTAGAENAVLSALTVSRIDLATVSDHARYKSPLYQTGQTGEEGAPNLPSRHDVACSYHYKWPSAIIGAY
jgi:hypothetical protein